MKLSNKTCVVTTTEIETYDLGQGFSLRVVYINGKINSQTIPCEYKHVYEFSYVENMEKFKKEAKENYFYANENGTRWYECHLVDSKNYLEYFQEHGFNKENLVGIKEYDHTFLDWLGNPIDKLVRVNYIGGFCQSKSYGPVWTDWVELGKHLKNQPDVRNFSAIIVPYYNSDFNGQTAYEFDIVAKSDWMKNVKNWKDRLTGDEEFDPLDVNQFKVKN